MNEDLKAELREVAAEGLTPRYSLLTEAARALDLADTENERLQTARDDAIRALVTFRDPDEACADALQALRRSRGDEYVQLAGVVGDVEPAADWQTVNREQASWPVDFSKGEGGVESNTDTPGTQNDLNIVRGESNTDLPPLVSSFLAAGEDKSAWRASVDLPEDTPRAPDAVLMCEGWWHPNVNAGKVHDHPDDPGRNWSVPMHRTCEQVYTRRAVGGDR